MQKYTKRLMAFAIALLMLLNTLPSGLTPVEAAKKVTISISSKKVKAQKKTTVTVKNLPKGAKVTVKSSKAKFASLAKNKATAKKIYTVKKGGTKKITIYAKSKGNAKITVVVKNKKGKKLASKSIAVKVQAAASKSQTGSTDTSSGQDSASAGSDNGTNADQSGTEDAKNDEDSSGTETADGKDDKSQNEDTNKTGEQTAGNGSAGGGSSSGGSSSGGSSSGNGSWTGGGSGSGSGSSGSTYSDFTLAGYQSELEIGEETAVAVTYADETKKTDLTWSSDNESVAAVVSSEGRVHALTPGTARITATSRKGSYSHSFNVTVKKAQDTTTATSLADLEKALTAAASVGGDVIVTYKTNEKVSGEISEGSYENVTLIIDAPNATITNNADFKQIIVKALAADTLVERRGNNLYFDDANSHVIFEGSRTPSLTILGGAQKVTVENNGNLKEILIAKAAEIVVKGDSIAKRVTVDNISGGKITTFVPLDITSTQTFELTVGPGGEQTSVEVSSREAVPEVSGVGTLTIKIEDTSETKSVVAEIAENQDELVSGKTVKVSGKILPEKEGGIVKADVYLVPFTLETSGDQVSVSLNKSGTQHTKAVEADGSYSFSDVVVGNYTLVVKADGYDLITQLIYLTANDYPVEDIQLLDSNGTPGSIEGTIVDAGTGELLQSKLTIILRKGMNNITSDEVSRIQVYDGTFLFSGVKPGQYTVQIRDDAEEPQYASAYSNTAVLQGAKSSMSLTVSKILQTDSVRFVLTWGDAAGGASRDLDIHVFGPDTFSGGENHIYLNNKSEWGRSYEDGTSARWGSLDVDDKEYEGPETITIDRVQKGLYKIFVKDYSSAGAGDSLYRSQPVIRIYAGGTLLETVRMTSASGSVWYAGDYDGASGRFTTVNETSEQNPNESLKAQIGTVFNQLQQFVVTDIAAFADYQREMDDIRAKYYTEEDETVLSGYLERINKVYENLSALLTVSSLTYKNRSVWSGDSFETYHRIYLRGTDSELDKAAFHAVFSNDDKGTVEVTKLTAPENNDDDDYYMVYSHVLKVNSPKAGASVRYYIDYYKESIEWIRSITNSADALWRTDIENRSAVVGGSASTIPESIEITPMDGISLVSREYKVSAVDQTAYEESYGTDTALVLHLKQDSTGATYDYPVRYIPLGADILRVEDPNNVINEQDGNYYHVWKDYDQYVSYQIMGENASLGSTWKPVVREGASYKIEAGGTADGNNCDALVTVTCGNGAVRKYRIYYYQWTADSELLGITDSENVFTNFSVGRSVRYGSEKQIWGTVELRGRNSELGKNLTVHARTGAKVDIDYTVTNDSYGDYSDALITITGAGGGVRRYYLSYEKTDVNTHVRAISADGNELCKVELGHGYLSITGSQRELGTLSVVTDAGYTSAQSKDELTVMDGTGTVVESYTIYYQRELSTLKPISAVSASDPELRMNNFYTYGRNSEGYDGVINLAGIKEQMPKDLVISMASGASAQVSYSEDDSYYAATVAATDKNGDRAVYQVHYTQDTSAAELLGITSAGNPFVHLSIEDYTSDLTVKDTDSKEEVYLCYAVGKEETVSRDLVCTAAAGATVSPVVYADEESWPYDAYTSSYYYSNDDVAYNYQAKATARVEITASNGAKRVYVIMYAQESTQE